ncbi:MULTISPECIES: hypothetical protein [unclassified Fusibacter]|uniref:hypothetical protein n=1 Tax=unclassified Fusibacter TaxID=2624464 RepID=UPI001011666E|nr:MULTISPECIES: hypothetical protein [unclassified Fusibacter]MCK8061144.1 hypothetical protein [Fusibacter sp. A2]NPE23320.1 hypothetical protein [Fusibacter sp. A1]RXV59362.1 hypothetical protein DWB64_15985 [Fusibacter sp. A1]
MTIKKAFSKPLSTTLIVLFLVLLTWKASPLITLTQSQATLTNINYESSLSVTLDEQIKIGKTTLHLDTYRVIGDQLQIDFHMSNRGNYSIESVDILLEDKNGPVVLSGLTGTGMGTIELNLKDAQIEGPLKLSVKDMYLVKIKSLGKAKDQPKSFDENNTKYVIEYIDTPLLGQRYQLTSEPSLKGTDIVTLYYSENKTWEKVYVLKHDLPLLLTKEALIDIVGQQEDYLAENVISKLQGYLEENENRLISQEELKEGLIYLEKNGGTTFYPDLNENTSSRVLQFEETPDLSTLTFGIFEKNLFPITPLEKVWLDIINF